MSTRKSRDIVIAWLKEHAPIIDRAPRHEQIDALVDRLNEDQEADLALSDHDRAHVAEILRGQGDWFSAQLLRLIKRSDHRRREQMRLAFPTHVDAVIDAEQEGIA